MNFKAVFHVDELEKWRLLLNNVANLMAEVEGSLKIVVVANSVAVEEYVAEAFAGNLGKMESLAEQGVQFVACQNALRAHNVEQDGLPQFVQIVPAGVYELVRLQHEGYAYLKP